MARKALKRRATTDEAANLLSDYATISSSPNILLTSEELRAVDPSRTGLLMLYTPRTDPTAAELVRDTVVDLILRVEYVSRHSDQAMLKIGYGYAIYCLRVYGEFVPARHLLDGPIKQWTHGREKSANTRSSEFAGLRRLRMGRRHVAQFSRNIATAPYTDEEWRPLRILAESGVNKDATALVHLSGHLGLRAHELTSATGNWIYLDDERTWLMVPDSDGAIRLIPAFGETADWLRSMYQVGAKHLIRPKRKWRGSLVTDVTASVLAKHPQFAGFKVIKARHRYITKLLDSATPLTVVHSVAGLKPGSALPVDLLKYLSEPSDGFIYETLRRGQNRRPRNTSALSTLPKGRTLS